MYKNPMRVRILILFLGIFLVFLPAHGARGGDGCRIFMVFSYHPGLQWHMNAERGLREALKGLGCRYRGFYMDTKRHPQETWIESKAREALAEMEDWKPTVVVTLDDNATRTVGGRLLGKSVPVVFLGVNADPGAYGFVKGSLERPGSNVTGVLERHYFSLTFKLLKALVPGIKRCAVISDDSYTSHMALDYCRSQEASFPVEVVGYYFLKTFQDWKTKVEELQDRVDCLLVYNALTLKGDLGKVVSNREVYRWMKRHSRLPDGGVWESPVRFGLLGGVILTGYYQGYFAGLKVRKILSGTPPGEIPIDRPPRGEIAINVARARDLGIKLPMGILLSARIYGGGEE